MLGILLPLCSNIIPIRKAVATSLRDALDIFRKKVDSFTITMTQMEDLGISPVQLMIGITFTVFGFVVYYFIPMALFYQRMGLFFLIILSVKFLMIVGMTFIAMEILPYLEKVIVWLIFILRPRDRKLKSIVLKNLKSHQ